MNKSIKSVNWQDRIKIHKRVTLIIPATVIIDRKEVLVRVIKQIIGADVAKMDGGSETNEDSN